MRHDDEPGDRHRVAGDDVGVVAELGRGLELALGVDDLRAPLALGLGLAGDRALHAARDLDVLDLDGRHLDPPWLGKRTRTRSWLIVRSESGRAVCTSATAR